MESDLSISLLETGVEVRQKYQCKQR